ncbi:MAG TPA: di-heme oxidoredictase family protein [Terriglobia bacterium]|nr:di-heme oxidoredictase family protein [Terriglobia bacterium]
MRWIAGSRRTVEAVEGRSLLKSAAMLAIGVIAVTAAVVPVKRGLGARTRPNTTVKDPGIRGGAANVGGMLPRLTAAEQGYFNDGLANFNAVIAIPQGLGPLFNENQCSSCHAQPAAGGGAPGTNPVFSVYQLDGAQNVMPSFETQTGPALVARFPFMSDGVTPDGTVHQLFTITGRSDAQGCSISQPTWPTNVALHQPLPVFGDGFLEIYDNTTLTANMSAVCAQTQFGVCGTPNISGNDGSILRLGWKAQWRSLTLAAGEEYNVESGVTNEFFPTELNQTPGCQLNAIPESGTNFNGLTGQPDQFVGAPTRMGLFMRFSAGPTPVAFNAAALNGQQQFINIGCATCHTFPGSNASMVTPLSSVVPLSQASPKAYTDLMLHHMGPCLADGIVFGAAQGDMFRTPPLWGDGKRIFFMHGGVNGTGLLTTDLLQAIQNHFCAGNSQYPASEANTVINNFNALSATNQQDILDFIRDL